MDKEEWASVIKEAKTLRRPYSQGVRKYYSPLYYTVLAYISIIVAVYVW
jgi:hypothetical protein